MAESMKDFERELEASFKRIDEGDIISGTVVSVDESGVVLDLKFYAEGFIPVEEFSRVPGFNIKEAVQPGDEVQAMVLRRDDGQGNILLSRADAVDVLAWDRLKELQDSGEVLDVVVKGIVNGGAIAYVEGVRGFIPASRLALEFVEDTEVFLNKPIQVRVPLGRPGQDLVPVVRGVHEQVVHGLVRQGGEPPRLGFQADQGPVLPGYGVEFHGCCLLAVVGVWGMVTPPPTGPPPG